MMKIHQIGFIFCILASRVVAVTSSHHSDTQVQWGTCDPSLVNDTSLSCGFLNVPLDYQDPSVGNARLAMIKANATGERRGTVLFNPGGPGEATFAVVNQYKELLLEVTGGAYDIVSWDPRGVGKLTIPGDTFCFDGIEEYIEFFNGTIELKGIEEIGDFSDPADVDALLAQAPEMQKKYEDIGNKCLRGSNGKFLRYMGTAATVRDMVSIANVLEGPDVPINYLGISFGTVIGASFVNMFPERVGKVIIDGVLDPVLLATKEISTHFWHQLVSVDTIYKALITGCALTGPTGCAAASEGDGALDIDAKVQALLRTAYEAAKVNTSAPLTSGLIRTQSFFQMYTPPNWSSLMNEAYPEAVQIIKGEAPGNLSLNRKSSDPTSRSSLMRRVLRDSPSYSAPAILCADSVDLQGTTMADVFNGIIEGTRKASHMFGAGWYAEFYQCSFWPVRSVERYQGPFNKKLANKIIVGSNTYDPITTLAGAQKLTSLLGEDAVLVRLNGFGHTAIVGEPSACIRQTYSAYFTNGTLPAHNTVCEVDADFEVFAGVYTGDILAHLPGGDI
ncbi:alpha/beta-hydrolase [Lentinus tigrinus ALCF2SS1-6]|uniref:Alpha/beta-hydrolase n=1 Tax=Lentinus tigrinus ALCF2SS1-6 TaxID=1328759 RepID=A0A5C2SIA9_9APHY|nr:alpha/beta-hydrolase [Lentinus tigrinus ALCF2SS1-6]